MKVAGEYTFDVTPEAVWAALHDRAMLAAALPGTRRLEPTGDDEYAISVDVGVGSIKGTYDGTFSLTEQTAPQACTVRANASGRPGSVQAVARMRMSDRDGRAHMEYEADATLTGPLAGVGQRLVGAAARRTTEQFLSELERLIVAPPGEEAEVARQDVAPAARLEASPRMLVASAAAGAAIALAGVAVGRWTARR
jgi:uncharacterized protein